MKNINEQLLDASRRGDIDKIKELLDSGADIETKNDNDDTPLLWASSAGFDNAVKLLLERGANTEAKTKSGNYPIIFASRIGAFKMVRLLLEYAANINVHNYSGYSCLNNLCEIWFDETIQELIINKQPHNIKFFDDEIGILPEFKIKYKEVIEMSKMGLF